MPDPDSVLHFWLEELTPADWYAGGEPLDSRIRDRFLTLWEQAHDGGLTEWRATARGGFAYILLTDQMPRNMFRDRPESFATDALALAAADQAIARGHDLHFGEPERQFFYLPFMHSERLEDQDRCIDLMAARLPESGADNLVHARAHREVIRRFGRFPTRNAALGRASTPAEADYLENGGYAAMVRAIREGHAGGA